MELKPKRPIVKGPSEGFTGDVWMDPLVQPGDHSTLNVAAMHFTPGTLTAWHAHEGGQALHNGRRRAGPGVGGAGGHDSRRRRRAHALRGVALARCRPDQLMTYLSLTHGPATWAEHVSDDEYGAACRPEESDV